MFFIIVTFNVLLSNLVFLNVWRNISICLQMMFFVLSLVLNIYEGLENVCVELPVLYSFPLISGLNLSIFLETLTLYNLGWMLKKC